MSESDLQTQRQQQGRESRPHNENTRPRACYNQNTRPRACYNENSEATGLLQREQRGHGPAATRTTRPRAFAHNQNSARATFKFNLISREEERTPRGCQDTRHTAELKPMPNPKLAWQAAREETPQRPQSEARTTYLREEGANP